MRILWLLSFLCFFSNIIQACDFPNVTEVVEISYVEKSYDSIPKLFEFEVVAPLYINGWRLNGVVYHEGGNNIPLRESIVKKGAGTEYFIFSLSLVPESIKNSHLSVVYWPPGVSIMEKPVCLLVEKLEYGI